MKKFILIFSIFITKYLFLLKNIMINYEYKLIKENQNLWIKQSKNDEKFILNFVLNPETTAQDSIEILQSRAEFLKEIFNVHADSWGSIRF